MSDDVPTSGAPRRRQGFWLTVGEIVGVLALVIAGLNFWESHRQHAEDAHRAQVQSQAETAFVTVGEADRDGRTIGLRPLKGAQAIQSQRYRFSHEVLDHPMDITAERPRIEADWIVGGVKRALDDAHAKSAGSSRLPVVIETVYVEDGDTRMDVSLYDIGFAWKHGFLGGWQIRLEGIALAKRAFTGDVGATLDKRWTATKTGLKQAVPSPPVS